MLCIKNGLQINDVVDYGGVDINFMELSEKEGDKILKKIRKKRDKALRKEVGVYGC